MGPNSIRGGTSALHRDVGSVVCAGDRVRLRRMDSQCCDCRLAANPIAAPLAESAKWLQLLALAGTAAGICYGLWRYSRWESGRDLGCLRCGGLLGEERLGRYSDFRRCLGCGHAAGLTRTLVREKLGPNNS